MISLLSLAYFVYGSFVVQSQTVTPQNPGSKHLVWKVIFNCIIFCYREESRAYLSKEILIISSFSVGSEGNQGLNLNSKSRNLYNLTVIMRQ